MRGVGEGSNTFRWLWRPSLEPDRLAEGLRRVSGSIFPGSAPPATSGLVPLQCEFLALEGLSQLVRTIDRVKRAFNPSLDIQGIVLTMYDTRNKLSSLVADDVRAYFGDKVYQTVIPRNVRVSEAPSHFLT